MDAILYVVRTGCSWRQLPADFPPWQTVYWYFVRVQQGRNPQPSAGIIGSQSVKGAGTVTRNSRGAKTTLLSMYLATPVRFVIADGGFAGELVDWASRILATTLHIVRKPEGRQGFAVIPRRWAVERTFAWLTAHRRLARGRPATRQPRWRRTDCK